MTKQTPKVQTGQGSGEPTAYAHYTVSLRVKALEFEAFVVRVWENTTSSLNLSLSQQENTQTLGAARFKPSAAQTVKALEFAALVVCV